MDNLGITCPDQIGVRVVFRVLFRDQNNLLSQLAKSFKLKIVQRLHLPSKYYLQVVKNGESPSWPRPEDELVSGSQDIGDGYTQHWAYFKEEGKESTDLPPAEEAAVRYPTPKPAVLIDQTVKEEEFSPSADILELILVKDGHALSRTDSSLDNIEDNLTSILDFAGRKFNIKVEHFMTTERVSKVVEKKLDSLEDISEGLELGGEAEKEPPLKHASSTQLPTSGIYTSKSSKSSKGEFSKFLIILPVVALVGALITTVLFKDQILSKFSNFKLGSIGTNEVVRPQVSPSPTEQPTATPVPVQRSEYKIRVLNGTLKSGAAGVLGKELESLGWEVSKVGNASDQTLEQTEVKAKKGLEDVVKQLVVDLGSEPTASFDLEDSEKVDIEVVIGKK